MIPNARLQDLLVNKDAERSLKWCEAYDYVEGWAICDGALVIYNVDDPPSWFDFERDENGDSILCDRDGECGWSPEDCCLTAQPGLRDSVTIPAAPEVEEEPAVIATGRVNIEVRVNGKTPEEFQRDASILNDILNGPTPDLSEADEVEYECCEECG